MKRHNDLIAKILRNVEETADWGKTRCIPQVNGYSEMEVQYHLVLCQEAGYLILNEVPKGTNHFPTYAALRLTWEGHNALERDG